MLQRLFPLTRLETLLLFHHYIRKAGHLSEYFVLSLLLLRGIRGGRTGWKWQWAVAALLMALSWSVLDEVHQAFVPSRGPSAYDVLIDVCGAAAAQVLSAALARLRRGPQSPGAPQEAAKPGA